MVVASITQTDFYDNLRLMARSAVKPLLLTCLLYLAIGFYLSPASADIDTAAIFREHFALQPVLLLPAAAVILLSCLRVDVRITMLVSMLLACVLCCTSQNMPIESLRQLLVYGYKSGDSALQAMLGGGGIFSMEEPIIIISISCSYAGFFQHTDLLQDIQHGIGRLAQAITVHGSVVAVGTLTCMIACNQTLSSILTQQLCQTIVPDKHRMMLAIENTAIIIAALIPWNIACTVPLHTLGVPATSIFFACYLYLQPWGKYT